MEAVRQRQEAMQRKPILMPPEMIKKVDSIAKRKKVSFAEVVRDAVAAFDEGAESEANELLEALADTMIETTKTLTRRIEKLEKKLDETHAILEVR
ncbi:MAG: hypothetical protein IH612_00780 [Desulfofustis sp.]|nr:hypothetical protein [Desulfofustis sp.]